MLNVWYLCHSGFAVETDRYFFVFDYWKDSPRGGLSSGVVNPHDLVGTGKPVVVLVSHHHPDHFNAVIFDWKRMAPDIVLVLADDIPLPSDVNALVMGPGETLRAAGLTIRTLASNDEGVAFLLELDRLRIFHAGDLNWWHWESEPDDWNNTMAARYKTEINKLRGLAIDLAFVPVDPRLGAHAALGVDYLMRTLNVRAAIPMHFWQQEKALEEILNDPSRAVYRQKILLLKTRGQCVSL